MPCASDIHSQLEALGRVPVSFITLSSVSGTGLAHGQCLVDTGLLNNKPLVLCFDFPIQRSYGVPGSSKLDLKEEEEQLSFLLSGLLQDQGLRPASVHS